MSGYTTDTFSSDHLIRNCDRIPIGRVVLRDDKAYVKGKDLQIALLSVPQSFKIPVKGLEFFIDGVKYKVPSDIVSFRVRKRERDLVVSNFLAKVVE